MISIDGKRVQVCTDCEAATVQFMRALARSARRANKHSLSLTPLPSPLSDSPPTHTPAPTPTGEDAHIRKPTPTYEEKLKSAWPKKTQPLLLVKEESVKPDVQEVVDFWNKFFSLPRISVIGQKAKSIQSALSNPFWRDNWQDGIKRIVKSDFCKGDNKRNWKADIIWLCNPENLEKLLNGKYEGDKPENPQTGKDFTRDEI